MGYRLIEADGTGLCERYGISGLLGLFLSAADLKEEQIVELLGVPQKVRTSQAQCVKEACARIAAAAENGEKVFVGGDYDADGICSTAIMKDVLDRLGIVNGYYIPDRFREGYGLRPETVRLAHGKGYTLIITVDNGVKAHEAIEEAHRLGMEIIVTDHHRIDEQPKADILVHPDFMEEEYQYLCGAGVALQISRTLIGDCPAHIAIAAVAHIGDVMELWKQTRAIVRQGTEYLDSGTVKAFSALNERKVPFDREVIGFQIAPKLNSVGRMNDISNVNTLVPFLLSKDDRTVLSYTMQLNHVNEMRKQLSADMVRQAERMMGDDPFPVICSPDFHEGICGLAAGRLARAYHRPVL
ncbi:MAG: DHH family phosphoesterase, partial [Solobacterium sp.]|nr:DHH family phosphoesterase [Solobacterium sp.]